MAFRYWFGAVLVVLGIGLLADQLLPALDIGRWIAMFWPLAVILLGAILLLTRSATWIGGVIILLLGCLLQIAALGLMTANVWGLLGPAMLILLGILVVFRMGRREIASEAGQDILNHFILFSGLETRPRGRSFRGGSITALFAGANIDLRETVLESEGAYLELTAAFSGIDLFVPKDWRMDINGIPLFGGWSNKSFPSSSTEGPLLTIRCLVLFGGIEIKN